MEILPEVEVWYGLPAVRRQLAVRLKAKGQTQKQIAALLGMTESAVSQYLAGKRGATELPSELDKPFDEAVQHILAGQNAKAQIVDLLDVMRETRAICKIHEAQSDVPKGCDCCFTR